MSGDERKAFRASQYALRSAFYYRAQVRWPYLVDLVAAARREADWADIGTLGISDIAWQRVGEQKVTPKLVFAHPDLIRAEPRLVGYYRNLALVPDKGMTSLAFSTTGVEAGRSGLSKERAQHLARVINGLISALVESDPGWSLGRAHLAAVLNVGSSVNGSWRNEIGSEGARQAAALIVGILSEDNALSKAVLRDGSVAALPLDPSTAILVRDLTLANGFAIRFAADPDVALRDEGDLLVATMEVKYGSDPAGALERYGAAKKSFEAAAHENAKVQNLYLANAITEEVARRIASDRLVTKTFEMTMLLADANYRQDFFSYLKRHVLDL